MVERVSHHSRVCGKRTYEIAGQRQKNCLASIESRGRVSATRQLLKKRAEDRVGLVIGPEKVGIIDDQRDLVGRPGPDVAATFLAVSAGLSRGGSSPTHEGPQHGHASRKPSRETSEEAVTNDECNRRTHDLAAPDG